MPSRPLLDRAQLSRIAQGVPQTIAGLEQLVANVGGLPTTIEEANALAGSALAVAQASMAALTALAEAIEQLERTPAPQPHVDPDDMAPRCYVGTLATQDADQVEIVGGAVDGTPIGSTTAAAGAFTTLTAGAGFGCNGVAAQAPAALGAPASDMDTAITLLNNIRAALIANGIGA